MAFTINAIKDNCITENIKSISKDFYFPNKISNTSIYSYKIVSDNKLK